MLRWVSIRSWPEFTGVTSGYSYIKPKGEIAGARGAITGSGYTHMEDFHNPDGTMRSADDIAAMWKTWNIQPEQHVAFYCGTGWRASKPLCTHGRWAGKTSPFTMAAGTNGAATRKARFPPGERGAGKLTR